MPVAAPAAHDVIALVDLLEEVGDVVRVILQVSVEENEDRAAAVIDARLHGGCLAEVAAEAHHTHPRIP